MAKVQINSPLISVIIPAFNEGKNIERLLESISHQTYPNYEIIVIDDGSKDSTVEIARRFTDKVYQRQHAERSVQRNFGAGEAKGKYLFFLDADMELTREVIASCVETIKADKKIGAIVIPEKSIAQNFWEKVKAFERSFYNLTGDTAIDAARFFSKKAFVQVGGYDEAITGPEDWDLPETMEQQGFKIGRIKKLIYHYENIPSLLQLAKKKFYYGLKSHRYLSKRKISVISPKTVYFLRPIFYRNWKKIVKHPLLGICMIMMLFVEMIAGGLGYLLGRRLYG